MQKRSEHRRCRKLEARLKRWLERNPGYYPIWFIAREAAPQNAVGSVQESLYDLSQDGQIVRGKDGRYNIYGALGQAAPPVNRTVPDKAREAVRAYFRQSPNAHATAAEIWGVGNNSKLCSLDAMRKACYAMYEAKELERLCAGKGSLATYIKAKVRETA